MVLNNTKRLKAAFGKSTGAQWLGTSLTNIGNLQSILLIGSTLRKEQPLLATRFRAAAKRGAQINVVHALDGDMLMRVANRSISKPENLAAALGAVTKALAEIKNAQLPGEVANAVASIAITAEAQAIAASLAAKELTGVRSKGIPVAQRGTRSRLRRRGGSLGCVEGRGICCCHVNVQKFACG